MKSGEIIGIAGGATVLGGIVWFIYSKTKGVKVSPDYGKSPSYEEQKRLDDDEDALRKIQGRNIILEEDLPKRGGTRSTKKTHNNIKNTKNTKNIKKGTKKR